MWRNSDYLFQRKIYNQNQRKARLVDELFLKIMTKLHTTLLLVPLLQFKEIDKPIYQKILIIIPHSFIDVFENILPLFYIKNAQKI